MHGVNNISQLVGLFSVRLGPIGCVRVHILEASKPVTPSPCQKVTPDYEAEERAHRPTNSPGGVKPGAYTASIDMDGSKTSPIGHAFAFQGARNSESLDSFDSDDDGLNFVSPREIDDQRPRAQFTGEPVLRCSTALHGRRVTD